MHKIVYKNSSAEGRNGNIQVVQITVSSTFTYQAVSYFKSKATSMLVKPNQTKSKEIVAPQLERLHYYKFSCELVSYLSDGW